MSKDHLGPDRTNFDDIDPILAYGNGPAGHVVRVTFALILLAIAGLIVVASTVATVIF